MTKETESFVERWSEWERFGVKRKVEKVDGKDVPLDDFRAKEAMEVARIVAEEDCLITFVRANSGYGISRFFIPRLRTELENSGLSATYLPAGIHAEYVDVCRAYPEDLGDVVIIDEFRGDFLEDLELCRQLMATKKGLKVVIITDDEATNPDERQKKKNCINDLRKANLLSEVEMNPKLFSMDQAVEYVSRNTDNTFFYQLKEEDIRSIIVVLSRKLPLHFRVLDAIIGIPFWDEVTQDDLTLQQRLDIVNDPKSIEQLQPYYDLYFKVTGFPQLMS